MSEGTERVIAQLSDDLAPVRRYPTLLAAAALVVLISLLMVAGMMGYDLMGGRALVKASLAMHDLLGVLGHYVLAVGALGCALGSCVPGRESVERACLGVAGLGILVTGVAGLQVLLGSAAPAGTLGAEVRWMFQCTLAALVPALIPAGLLTYFAARGASHRPLRTLAFGALATVSFATLPGHLGCTNEGVAHTLLGHMLLPLLAGAIVLVPMWGFYRPALPPVRGR